MWLITKEGHHALGTSIFTDTELNITSQGRPYLGAAIGSSEYVERFEESTL